MAIISPALPTVGSDPRGTGEAALRNDILALLTEFNGNIDNANVKSGAGIAGSKLAAASVAPDRLSAGIVSAGKSIIATTESRTNVAYGTLTTPDQVAGIVLPTDGLIRVRFMATWQESVSGAGRAALFIGANQLKVPFNSQANPVTEAAGTGGGTAARDTPLFSVPWGLASSNVSAAYGGDVTTGQAVAFVKDTASNVYSEINGTMKTDSSGTGTENFFTGGAVDIFAAAGTYTISVQFKSSSGSVTAKNRKLWVEAVGF